MTISGAVYQTSVCFQGLTVKSMQGWRFTPAAMALDRLSARIQLQQQLSLCKALGECSFFAPFASGFLEFLLETSLKVACEDA